MPQLNVAARVECTEVEGPGKRFALWVQGCLKRCQNCCNPHMLEIVPRHVVDAEAVFSWVYNAHNQYDIEGVTFVGGEPMLQARGLAHIARQCQEVGLSVVIFTGYTIDELERLQVPGTSDLMANTDLLVDGPYLSQFPEIERNWAGSTNQRFHFLTDRYPPGIEYDPEFRHGLELRIGRCQQMSMNGWPASLESAACAR